jgi:hypothetical protein
MSTSARRSRSAASEGGSVRGSPCGKPARLRLTSLRPHSFGLLRSPALTKWHAAVEHPTAVSVDIVRPVASATETGDPGRCGGFRAAACGARRELRRAERQRAGEGRERSGAESPREPGSPVAVPGNIPMGDIPISSRMLRSLSPSVEDGPRPVRESRTKGVRPISAAPPVATEGNEGAG